MIHKPWYALECFLNNLQTLCKCLWCTGSRKKRPMGAENSQGEVFVWSLLISQQKSQCIGSNRIEQKQLLVVLFWWWRIPKRLKQLFVRPLVKKPLWIPHHPKEYFPIFYLDLNSRKQKGQRIAGAWSFSPVRNGFSHYLHSKAISFLKARLDIFTLEVLLQEHSSGPTPLKRWYEWVSIFLKQLQIIPPVEPSELSGSEGVSDEPTGYWRRKSLPPFFKYIHAQKDRQANESLGAFIFIPLGWEGPNLPIFLLLFVFSKLCSYQKSITRGPREEKILSAICFPY